MFTSVTKHSKPDSDFNCTGFAQIYLYGATFLLIQLYFYFIIYFSFSWDDVFK